MIVYNFLVSAAFLLSGLYLALDFFTARKWLPSNIADQIRAQGPIIGLAVCLISILHLLFGGIFVLL